MAVDSGDDSHFDAFHEGETYRRIVVECDAETLERMRKRADVTSFGDMTIYSDEPTTFGGDRSAPSPLAYFASAILF